MTSINTEIADILRDVAAGQWGIPLSDNQLAQFTRYAELLVEWNATRMNLTRVTEPREIAVKHFLDSLSVLRATTIPTGARLIDIGTGAGLPGLALKIVRPDLHVTLLDSTAKKLLFCRAVADDLNLDHVTTLHDRAEEAAKEYEHARHYDIVTARAVAPLERLLPWCVPFLNITGQMVLMKGPGVDDELPAARPIARNLGINLSPPILIELPDSNEPMVRRIVIGRRMG